MANTYSEIYIQCVFAVKRRENLISKDIQNSIFSILARIIKESNAFPIVVGGYRNHVHILFSYPPTENISEIMRKVKARSSKWINEKQLIKGSKKFEWQSGFGAFSYSKSQIEIVKNYILNQEAHHKKKSFLDEYVEFLEKFGIEYDPRYLFEDVD